MSMERQDRREFLGLSLSGAFALFLGGGLGAGCDSDGSDEPVGPHPDGPTTTRGVLENYFQAENLEPLHPLAEAWLEAEGATGDDAAIEALIEPTRSTIEATDRVGEAAEALVGAVTGDFAAERVVRVQGWHLSETELHMSVLALRTPPAEDRSRSAA